MQCSNLLSQVCKKLRKRIDNSETLRYILALHMCGMHDNPSISTAVPLLERVTRLGAYDAARRSLSFTTYHEISSPTDTCVVVSSGYVVAMSAGKVTMHRPASKLRGIEARTWSFSFGRQGADAGVDSDRDLLVIISELDDHKRE